MELLSWEMETGKPLLQLNCVKKGSVDENWYPGTTNPLINFTVEGTEGDYFYVRATQADGDQVSAPVYMDNRGPTPSPVPTTNRTGSHARARTNRLPAVTKIFIKSVSGQWSGVISGSGSASTNSRGQGVIQSGVTVYNGPESFSVTDISAPGPPEGLFKPGNSSAYVIL